MREDRVSVSQLGKDELLAVRKLMTGRLALPSCTCFTLMYLLFTFFISDEYIRTFHKASNLRAYLDVHASKNDTCPQRVID